MAEESHLVETGNGPKKRSRLLKGKKAKKKQRMVHGTSEKIKIDKKMKKLFQKRAREYNSDDDDDPGITAENENLLSPERDEVEEGNSDVDDAEIEVSEGEGEEDGVQPGITKFTEGCRAFRMAFKKITKENLTADPLGPVLSRQKRLLAEKLAEEESEQKVKGESKKDKKLVQEKGHVKPDKYLDSHEKFLIGVATKGVVKLFNAVNKAQNAQKGLDPSRFKDAKAIRKRRKKAFFSELSKTSAPAQVDLVKVIDVDEIVSSWSLYSVMLLGLSKRDKPSRGQGDSEGPTWAPLRDSYMLTSSKLKDWDKMEDTSLKEDGAGVSLDSSDDE
ncbi:Ribosomal RNA-processing protein 15 [Dillenia turbinata]|uniref:Ribosomal RNA-processing protein 15 n=1 Tax=Dillenia turbinata TaxID=194707 RepID=A0AAN8UGT4_9MAGN